MTSRSTAQHIVYWLARIAARLVGVVFWRMRCHGRQHLPAVGGAILCANHQSFLDPVLVGLTCDRRLNFLARDTLFHRTWSGWLMHFFDAISIQREGLGIAGFRETSRRLKAGEIVLVFPEGTRTHDGQVGPLHAGVCRLARRAAVPLIPVALDGAYQAWPRDARWPRLSTIHLCIGPPIAAAELEGLSDERLLEELATRLRACFTLAQSSRQRARAFSGRAPGADSYSDRLIHGGTAKGPRPRAS